MAGFDRFCASHHPARRADRELATAWCRDTGRHMGAYRTALPASSARYLRLPAWTLHRAVRVIGRPAPARRTCSPSGVPPSSGGRLHRPQYAARPEYAIPVIFRLILGAGLRPPEARRCPPGR